MIFFSDDEDNEFEELQLETDSVLVVRNLTVLRPVEFLLSRCKVAGSACDAVNGHKCFRLGGGGAERKQAFLRQSRWFSCSKVDIWLFAAA